jgi:hypothetical protein
MSGSRPSRAAARDAPPTRTTELAYRHQMKPVMVKGADGSGEPVAWVTLQPVSDAGKVWAALSNAHVAVWSPE